MLVVARGYVPRELTPHPYPLGQQAGVLTVGALEVTGVRASFSNFGSCVDLSALGVNVPGAALPSGMVAMSGTSMASPQVAGVSALFLEKRKAAAGGVVPQDMGALAMADVLAAAATRGARLNMGVLATGAVTPPPPAPPQQPPPVQPAPAPPQPAPKPLSKTPNPVRKTSDATSLDLLGWAIGVVLMVMVID